MDPFWSHSTNMIIYPTDSIPQPKAYVNMVMVTSTIPPTPSFPNITFTTQDIPLKNKPSPLYILTHVNGNIVMGVLIDPMSCVNVITKETLLLNSLQKKSMKKQYLPSIPMML